MSDSEVADLANELDKTSLERNATSESPVAAANAVETIDSGLNTTLGGSNTSSNNASGPRSGQQSSNGSSESNDPRNKYAPVSKRDLPYKQQTFLPRPAKKAEDSKFPTTVVEANYFKLTLPETNRKVFLYNVAIHIEKEQRSGPSKEIDVRRREEAKMLFWEFVMDERYKSIFPPLTEMVYNDNNILWTQSKLRMDRGDLKMELMRGQAPRRERVQMHIKFVEYVEIPVKPLDKDQRCSMQQFFDLLMTMRVRCDLRDESRFFRSYGSSIFFVPDKNAYNQSKNLVVSLSRGFDAWTGLHGAVKDCEGGIFYNVDIHHSVFHRTLMPLVEFYAEFATRGRVNPNDLRRVLTSCGMDKNSRFELSRALKGLQIRVTAPIDRSKKFVDISDRPASNLFFTMENGSQISVANYFYQKYNISLNYPMLPCVALGKKGVYFPMELCCLAPDPQKYKGQLPEAQRAEMVRGTAFHPMRRRQILLDMTTSGDNSNSSHLADDDDWMRTFGPVKIDKNFVNVKATQLPVPTLVFGTHPTIPAASTHTDSRHAGQWEVSNKDGTRQVLHQGKKIVAAAISVNVRENIAPQHFANLMDAMANFGVEVPHKPGGVHVPFIADNWSVGQGGYGQLINNMMELKKRVEKQYPGATPMCVFVFPQKCSTLDQRKRKDDLYFNEYNMIKYICDVKVGIHCQGILIRTYKNMSGGRTCTTTLNVALKMLGKIDAQLYKLERDGAHKNWTRITNPEEPTLILGLDVTHPGEMDRKAGGANALSVGCVVGNVDLECMRYQASYRVQEVGKETILNMSQEIMDRISAFASGVGKHPAHVVVYRDGVGETDFQEVLYEEKRMIEEALKQLQVKSTLTFIVLTKRHHTRFFPKSQGDTISEGGNLMPGTLVESTITSKNYFDFFLLSHFGPIGTSRPTHYYVLWDTWVPSPVFWQTITYALCYAYVRCTKSVSQPAPVLYAHLASKRAKEYLLTYKEFDESRDRNQSEFTMHMKMNEALRTSIPGMIFV